jgi:hypothetical protein
MPKKWLIFVVLPCALSAVRAQNVDLSGYVSDMPAVVFVSSPREAWWQNQAHNRLNIGWQAGNFRVDASARTRFLAGSETMLDAGETASDKGWADLSWNLFAAETPGRTNALLNVALDRLNLTYEKNKLSLRIGRQRINWGQNFVWNPNDIFNTYSFFDFDYPERPGCDAFRGTWYHSPTSATELAVSLNNGKEVTAAALHRFNWRDFDFQLIAGVMNTADAVLGGAWAGDIKGVSVRGEFSYFHPLEKPGSGEVPQESFAISLGLDYSFENSLMLQAEALYNTVNLGGGLAGDGIMGLYAAPLSAKALSFSNWNVFAQASYPFSPRLSGAASCIIYPDREALYGGLSLTYSLTQNFDLSLFAQHFYVALEPAPLACILGFVRLKYSF